MIISGSFLDDDEAILLSRVLQSPVYGDAEFGFAPFATHDEKRRIEDTFTASLICSIGRLVSNCLLSRSNTH